MKNWTVLFSQLFLMLIVSLLISGCSQNTDLVPLSTEEMKKYRTLNDYLRVYYPDAMKKFEKEKDLIEFMIKDPIKGVQLQMTHMIRLNEKWCTSISGSLETEKNELEVMEVRCLINQKWVYIFLLDIWRETLEEDPSQIRVRVYYSPEMTRKNLR